MGPFLHPRKAPLFEGTNPSEHAPILGLNDSAAEILTNLGYNKDQIDQFLSDKIIG